MPRRKTTRRTAAEATELVAAFQRSGLSREAFCRSRKLSTSTLDYWRRRVRREDPPEPTLVPVSVVSSLPDSAAPYEVELTNGRQLRVSTSFEAESLARLLSVVDPLC